VALIGLLFGLRRFFERVITDPQRAALIQGLVGMSVLTLCTGALALYEALIGNPVPAVLAGLAALAAGYSAILAALDLRGHDVSRWYLRLPWQRRPPG